MTTTRRSTVTAALAAVLLAACGGSTGDDTVAPLTGGTTSTVNVSAPAPSTTEAAATTAASAAEAPTTVATGGDRAGTPVPAVTARSVDHRQFTVSVDGAVTSKEEPDTFDQPGVPAQMGDATYLYVKVAVKNRVSFASGFIAYDEAKLVPATGDPITMDDGVGTATDVVDGGATNRGWFAYPVPVGFDVTGASIAFGEAGEEPTTLPLTGTPPTTVWPKTITVSSPGAVTLLDGDQKPFTVNVTIDTATLSTAVAYDTADRTSVATKQALAGRRWLYVAFTANLVAPAAANHTSEVFGFETARLVVNGERQSGSPEESDSEILEPGTPYHGVYVFDVPATGRVQLAWGEATPVLVDVPVS